VIVGFAPCVNFKATAAPTQNNLHILRPHKKKTVPLPHALKLGEVAFEVLPLPNVLGSFAKLIYQAGVAIDGFPHGVPHARYQG